MPALPFRLERNPMKEHEFTEQLLADGSTLVFLKHRFLSKRTREQRDWVFACLKDSVLAVPVLPVSGKPDLLEDPEGKKFLPIFSQETQMPEDYLCEFNVKRLPYAQCLQMAKDHPEIDGGLCLDPFTEPMDIDFPLGETILKMPSRRMERP